MNNFFFLLFPYCNRSQLPPEVPRILINQNCPGRPVKNKTEANARNEMLVIYYHLRNMFRLFWFLLLYRWSSFMRISRVVVMLQPLQLHSCLKDEWNLIVGGLLVQKLLSHNNDLKLLKFYFHVIEQLALLSLLLILGAGNNIIITRAGYNEAQLFPAP